MLFQTCNEDSRIIPITGMTEEMTMVVFGVLLPILVSIITAIVFARFVAPLFLKAKNKILSRKYTDGFILRTTSPLSKKILIRRMIYLILLTFGFLSSIIPIVDPTQWLSPETICSYAERGLNPQYHFQIFLTLMGFVFPLTTGLWAVSWAIEDAGLMHYAFKSEDNYEIEPIHIKYTSYLKGYAGISGLMFVIQFTMYQAVQNSSEDAYLILAVVLIAIVCFFPTYFLFIKIMGSHGYLRKGLKEFKKLTESDLKN